MKHRDKFMVKKWLPRAKCLRKAMVVVIALLVAWSAPAVGADKNIAVQNGQKVAFMGDSITAFGWGQPGGYVKLIADGLDQEGIKIDPIPAGVSGNTSKDMLARLDQDVISKKPDWMTLSCGVNDVWHGVHGVDLDDYKKNITAVIDQATAAGIKVVVLTATPIGEEDNDNNKKLVDYNEFLRGLAKQRGLPLADLNSDFEAILKPLAPTSNSRNLTADGVHMNPDGNVVMAKGVLRAMGVPADDLEKIEQAWIDEPNGAVITCGYFAVGPPTPTVTLGQFRAFKAIAAARGANFEQLMSSLWLQALGEAMQSHLQDTMVDLDAVKKDASDRLEAKIAELMKKSAPASAAKNP